MKRLIAILLLTALLAGCVSECGDGLCELDENTTSCPEDCTATIPSPVIPSPEPVVPEPITPTPEPQVPATPTPEPQVPKPVTPSLGLEAYACKDFSMQKPVGWNVYRAGKCETFAVIVRDPTNPTNTIFYFNELGPMYSDAGQMAVDDAYMAMGGYPVTWRDAPVLNPATPEKFLEIYPDMTQMQISKEFTQAWPSLDGAKVVSSKEEAATLEGLNAKTMRVLFSAGSEVGEGMVYVGVMGLLPCNGMPSSCISYAFSFTGMTAEKDAFRYYEPALSRSLQSLNISGAYLSACAKSQKAQLQGALEVSSILSQTSDVIMESWEVRQASDDIISEKWSDGMFGRERVYNPDTGDVFEVGNGFYEEYELHRGDYTMSDLQQLPAGDHELWTAPTLNGAEHIR